jgi:Plasma-membrane choline transporter
MWIASICWVAAGLYYLCMACNFKSLRISIAIIETAADFFADTKRIAFVPFIYFSVWVGVFIFWLWGLCGVASIADSEGITVSNV